DDPIACLNKAMAFLTVVASLRFPTTNNQLRTSSNPRNQATIQDRRVTVQQVKDIWLGISLSLSDQGMQHDLEVSASQAQTIIPLIQCAFQLRSRYVDSDWNVSRMHKPLAEQAFWFHILNPTIEPSFSPPVIMDVPSELPKVSLVNASLKKLKFHLAQFDYVVKKRTTPSALEEKVFGENGVKKVLTQMEAAVQQSSVDKQCVEIINKELLLENDRLLHKIMSQDVMITVMNSMSVKNESVNMEMQICKSCDKCLHLDAEFSKSKQAYNDLLKSHSQLEKHVKGSTSASGSKPSGNTKNNRISQPSSSNKINKVKDQPRRVKTRKNKKNRVNKVKCNDNVMQSTCNANSVSDSISNASVKNSVNAVKSD
ncbi:hypothetical protein Tco_1190389, partial [Tanacetum coccineum]